MGSRVCVGVIVCVCVFSMSLWQLLALLLTVQENLLASSQVSFWSFSPTQWHSYVCLRGYTCVCVG